MMAKGKKRVRAPQSAAGLITYFEEEVGGIKLRPEAIVALAVGLMLCIMIAHLVLPIPP